MKLAKTIVKEMLAKGKRPDEIKSYLRGYFVPTGGKHKPKHVRQYRAGIELLLKETDK